MITVAVLFADGTEEIEALTPVDLLRRAGVFCDLVSVSGAFPVGSHNIAVKADLTLENVNFSDYSGIVIPGGMPGATNISNCQKAVSDIKKADKDGKLVGAI